MRRKLWQATVAVFFAGSTAVSGWSIASHGVPAHDSLFAIACMVGFGALITRSAGSPRTHTYTCPQPGCGISARSRGNDPAVDRELRARITNHAQHTTGDAS